MNSSPENTTPTTPNPERLNSERIQAMNSASFNIQEIVKGNNPPVSVEMYGATFPIREGSVADQIVADAQAIYKAANTVHQEAIKEGNYYKEKASAILENLYKNNELLISNFAEILEHYPEVVMSVAKNSPGLLALIQSNEADNQAKRSKRYDVSGGANDSQYEGVA